MRLMKIFFIFLLTSLSITEGLAQPGSTKTRVIITTDGEIDDECSMIRCLLYANEWDIEGIITSSSQYHWQGHNWAGDGWMEPYLEAYEKVYPNLVQHSKGYPTPGYIRERTMLGNVKSEGEMDEITKGSEFIKKILLNKTDSRPVWLQAWGGTNTIARALKSIEQEQPDRMAEVAKKMRFFFIWEQDSTYQYYIRPHWGKYNILTIISDQFEAIAYRWKTAQPKEMHQYFEAAWMKKNILNDHGPLCSLYKAHREGDKDFNEGDFRSEGDSPSFMHEIVTGLRNLEHPDWGGWGGRYVRVRDNTWLDPVPVAGYQYPEGRWFSRSAWSRANTKKEGTVDNDNDLRAYFNPIWRWTDAFQNDFAARAAWCVKPYKEANHPPVVKLQGTVDRKVKGGDEIRLSAKGTTDPDGNKLLYHWWQYAEAGSCRQAINIWNADSQDAFFVVPSNVNKGETIHIICEVKDNGMPQLTRYQRVVLTIQ